MNIINLMRLVDGQIGSTPLISGVDGFASSMHEITQRSAFIKEHITQDEADEACQRGAYAIITGSNLELKNSEIAYIKVSNFNLSLFRLALYFANLKQCEFYHISNLEREIFHSITKSVKFVPTLANEFYIDIVKAGEKEIFITDDISLINKFSTKKIEKNSDFNLLFKGSLFFSSFIFNSIYYQNLQFPRIFLDELCSIISFLDEKKLKYRVPNFINLSHFYPIFVNNLFKIYPFGMSDRAIIAEENREIFLRSAKFLKDEFSSKIVVCAGFGAPEVDFVFENLDQIREIKDFHYILLNSNKDELIYTLSQKKDDPHSLF